MARIKKLFFADCECTDLPKNDPEAELIEVAGAILNLETWQVEESYTTLIQHSRPLATSGRNPPARTFAGVDFGAAIPLPDALRNLLSLWSFHGAAWIGQNPPFDQGLCKPAAAKHGIRWPEWPEVDYHTFDVASMMLPRYLWGEIPSVSLEASRLWAGCTGSQSHRAMGDVQDLIQVFRKIVLRDLKRESQRPPPEPRFVEDPPGSGNIKTDGD